MPENLKLDTQIVGIFLGCLGSWQIILTTGAMNLEIWEYFSGGMKTHARN